MKVVWMYHDIMDLYGDKGNMMVLKKRCLDRGIPFELDTCGIGEEKDLSEYDLIFLGGGADKEQISLIPDLLSRKENIKKAMDEKTFVLLICGGYQLFGQYYIAANNEKISGLQFYDYYTDTGKAGSRCIGNVVIDADLDGLKTRIVGFENHGGQTFDISNSFGKVLFGNGNKFGDSEEGFFKSNVIATYLHGPLLSKNPELADYIIKYCLDRKYDENVVLEPINDEFENLCREQLLNRFLNQN